MSSSRVTEVAINPRYGVFGLNYLVKAGMRQLGYPDPLDSIHVQHMSRHNKMLIQALRDVGLQNAGYNGGRLEIAIVMGDRYIIKRYDGKECVLEPRHFKWTLLPPGVNKVAYSDAYSGFELPEAVKERMRDLGSTHDLSEPDDIPRHDPILVKAIEEYWASGSLKIAIVSGRRYVINEYDSWESVKVPSDIEWVMTT